MPMATAPGQAVIANRPDLPRDQEMTPCFITIDRRCGNCAITVIGGIFLAIFSPREAGALGAFTAFLTALVRGKVNRPNMREAFTNFA